MKQFLFLKRNISIQRNLIQFQIRIHDYFKFMIKQQFFLVYNFLKSIFQMDDLVLDIFANARKNKISKKDFEQIPVRDSQKNTDSSKKVPESTLSIGKNLDDPKSSDAFKNLMKGVYDMGKRIEQKYSNKNIQQTRPTSSKQTQQNKRWKPNIDKIKQQKNQDGEHSKEDIGVGTSLRNLQNPYLQPPIRIISPEGSRIVAGPDNSRIIFPPQIVQVRPLSPPSRYQAPMNSRVIVNQPVRVQPINRSPARIVSYSPPPQRVSPSPPVRFHYPQSVSPPPQHVQYIQQAIPVQYILQQPHQPIIHNNYPNYPNYPAYYPIPSQQPQQQLHQYQSQYPINKTASPPENNPQNNQNTQRTQNQQKQPKITGTPTLPTPPPAQPTTNPSKSMTPEQYQALLQKQYQQYNSQNSQLMKHLCQLTQQQKKQYANQQLLQQALKNTQNTKTIKNVINQKQVTKIIQKKIVNKQNIQNIQNVRNQVNMCNVSNQFNMQNVQNLQNIQAIQYMQQLQQLYGNDPKMLNNQILLKQLQLNMGSQSTKKLALQQQGNKSLINITSNNSLPKTSQKLLSHPPPPPPPPIPLQQQITQQKLQKQIFTQNIQWDIEKLDDFKENINMDYHIADLNDIKVQNMRDGMSYLRKMDQLIDRFDTKKVVKFREVQVVENNREESIGSNLMTKLFSNIFTNQPKTTVDPVLVQSVISPLPETHTKILPTQTVESQEQSKQKMQQSEKKSKHFLTLTKDMVVDFFTGLV